MRSRTTLLTSDLHSINAIRRTPDWPYHAFSFVERHKEAPLSWQCACVNFNSSLANQQTAYLTHPSAAPRLDCLTGHGPMAGPARTDRLPPSIAIRGLKYLFRCS